jgi:Fe2+ transport system protein B
MSRSNALSRSNEPPPASPGLARDAQRGPRRLSVAFAGNPKSGKTSLFNALTGGRQRVANYPGVSIERRSGTCVRPGTTIEILDLPGTYSLAPTLPEERIALEAILHGWHDVVVVVVDSMTLKRSLGFLAQVMQTGARPVLCLNMSDEARDAGQRIDVARMGIIYSMGEADEGSMGLRHALNRDYSPLTGLSMMLFLLIGTPCMATFAVTRSESGSVKWALLQFAGLTAVAYVVSLTVYQIGRLLA